VVTSGGTVGVVAAHRRTGSVDTRDQISGDHGKDDLDKYERCGSGEEDRGRTHVLALRSGADRGSGSHGVVAAAN